MRRSKSDPAKYARNYRKISQRRMTQYDGLDEEKEMESLRAILKNSQDHLKDDQEDEPIDTSLKNKRKRGGSAKDNSLTKASDDLNMSLLSDELQLEQANLGDNPLIVLPSKKKKKAQKPKVQLTKEEIKQAKTLQKNTARKLETLEKRAEQKKLRADLYAKLEKHQVSAATTAMLSSSGALSRKSVGTKKQILQKLLQKERAGITLTEEEKELLYPERIVEEPLEEVPVTRSEPAPPVTDKKPEKSKEDETEEDAGAKKKNKNKKKGSLKKANDKKEDDVDAMDTDTKADSDTEQDEKIEKKTESKPAESGFNFAAQMMASLSQLNQDSTKSRLEDKARAKEEEEKEMPLPSNKIYIPSEPTVLKTAAALGIQSIALDSKRKVMRITRPEVIEKARYDLPVSAMEFEIMDAIRNNDVTILCGETGSGKSTQVPQFLYEGGFSVNSSDSSKSFLIGITQPRRVAAVSTAKRVCYEVGQGDGQVIKGSGKKGNLVSYQTRYETAGLGSETRIKFMTDGILLQEIQSDLLLRKYSVIVLDESHERNLNTDVLIGLLSVALPLRKKAAEEDPSLVPLRLILMSATLRVEDFTKNDKLFPTGPPAVVTVPGRTHPVTIHHSKATELDDYESIALRKVCKMHRKLPHGGILVFLTGKQEIVRMVNKLRRALKSGKQSGNSRFTGANDVSVPNIDSQDGSGPREIDDEEVDGEDADVDDYDEIENDNDDDIEATEADDGESNEAIPSNAYILPLYSMLSAEEQAKIFAPVPEDSRLIVVATNIAETSITIPGISYVVDTGRQKCRNYNSGTGIASYDIMWISRAAADQRAGRAGRTGPGHCYRLYSSSLYSRHMDAFALPEVLTRPLEDVVLAMKALKISQVASFPFPTPPDRGQIDSAVKLLANIGCLDLSRVEEDGGDGVVTRLGEAVAKLPLGVRYGKILLVAANAGVLDYAIAMVSVLSGNSPFMHNGERDEFKDEEDKEDDDSESLDEIDKNKLEQMEKGKKKQRRWNHKCGDALAGMLAVGGYTYVGRGAGGASEQAACRKFCEENSLNYVVMTRIQKMRAHLSRLAHVRMSSAEGVAAKTGGFVSSMPPPNKLQENLLVQAIASGLLDNIALLAPPGSVSGEHPFSLRTAYLSCSTSIKEPLFMDRNSVVFSRDSRQLPQWICYDSIVRKTAKDGTPVSMMKNITPIDPSWIGTLAKGSRLLVLGAPLSSPPPSYDEQKDAIMVAVSTKFGSQRWEIPSVKQVMYDALQLPEAKHSAEFMMDDSFRWFAKFLLEGKIIEELKGLKEMLSDSPTIITRKTPVAKVSLLVSALSSAGVDSAAALRKHWAEQDNKFLFKCLKSWIRRDRQADAKKLWIEAVKQNVSMWKEG